MNSKSPLPLSLKETKCLLECECCKVDTEESLSSSLQILPAIRMMNRRDRRNAGKKRLNSPICFERTFLKIELSSRLSDDQITIQVFLKLEIPFLEFYYK
jgi:hypothetical protein